MTASSGSGWEPEGWSGPLMGSLRRQQAVSQGFQAAPQQRGNRRDGPAKVVGDLLERLAAAVLEDDDLTLRLRQVGQGVGKAEQFLVALGGQAGRRLVCGQPAGQPARRTVQVGLQRAFQVYVAAIAM